MVEFLQNIIIWLFGNNVKVATIIISMIPIIELKGAIPFATNSLIWGEAALSSWSAFFYALIGSSFVVFLLALIFFPIIRWLKTTKFFGKIAKSLENWILSKSKKISNENDKSKRFSREYWIKVFAIFALVSLPFPLTGVWTGTCVAIFLGLDYLTTCTTVVLGNLLAGVIITLILQFFPSINNYLFFIFLIIVALIIVYEILKTVLSKKERAT